MNLEGYQAGLDRGASRLTEALWLLAKIVFFLPSIPWPSSWRRSLLRLFGATIGKGVVIRSGVDVTFPWRFRVGDHVWLGERSRFLSLAPIVIGSHVCISQEAMLCTGSHDASSDDFKLLTGSIHVGNECWLAARVFLGPGVRVGYQAIVGAGSVVVRDVPAGMIVAGNPARVIRPRIADKYP